MLIYWWKLIKEIILMKRIKQNSLKLCVISIDTSYFKQFLLLLLLLNSLLCTFTVGLVWIDFSNPYPREFFWHFTLTFWHCNTFSHEDDELLRDFHIPLKVSAKLLKKNIPRFSLCILSPLCIQQILPQTGFVFFCTKLMQSYPHGNHVHKKRKLRNFWAYETVMRETL